MKHPLTFCIINFIAPIKDLQTQLISTSKYFRQFNNKLLEHFDSQKNSLTDNSILSEIYTKEYDELVIKCFVNSSKPAVDITLWIMEKSAKSFLMNKPIKLEKTNKYTIYNDDSSIKSIVSTKYLVKRGDNQKLLVCSAENAIINDKWQTKNVLNVLCKLI